MKYRAGDFDSYAFGRNADLLYGWPRRKARLLSRGEAELLRSCSAFRPLEQHAEHWLREQEKAELRRVSSLPLPRWLRGFFERIAGLAQSGASRPDPARAAQLTAKLRRFAEEGLLVSQQEWLDAARLAATGESPPPAVATIGFATRDRAETMERALASYIENTQAAGRDNDFVLIDDSTGPDRAEHNRKTAAQLAERTGAKIRYAGPREREAFVEVLSHSTGVPRPVIEFALCGAPPCPVTTGAAYNNLLLDTIGDLFVLADDDTVCRVAAPPRQHSGLRITSERDPTRMWFFDDRESVHRQVPFREEDFLGLHAALLGREIGECLPAGGQQNETGLDLDTARPRFLRKLAAAGGRILLSCGGIAGDSGIDMTAYLYVDPESRARLTASRNAYLKAVESRQLLRAAPRPAVSEGAFCMAGNLGLDNRTLLPPFLPVQRNTEGVFASTLRALFPHDYLAYIPWAVLHESPDPRRQDIGEFFRQSRRVRFAGILQRLIEAAPEVSESATRPQALRSLGRYLRDLGSRSANEFEDFVRQRFLLLISDAFEQQEAWRSAENLPRFYAEYRERYLDGLKRSLASLEHFTPRDLRGVMNEEGLRWLVPRLVRQYGDLLMAWPQIVEGARKLRAQGIRVALEV